MNNVLLLILDGYGIAEDPSVSAIDAADTPYMDHLLATRPHATLEASGRAVGLPEGQMGNSEVGHMNLGAGRIVDQDITRIDKAIEEGAFFANDALRSVMETAKERDSRVHLLGLVSDGGVHSSLEHLKALIELAKREGLSGDDVVVHAFTDGRDTDPHGGVGYLKDLERTLADEGVGVVGSVVGRYFAMDRDRRWDRTKRAFDLLVAGKGIVVETPVEGIEASYANDVTDEFVEPIRIDDTPRIQSGDVVLFFNFRADRVRQIVRAFTEDDFSGFDVSSRPDTAFFSFTPYHHDFTFPVAFPKPDLQDTLGEVVSRAGLTQLRAAETEKYPHVTFFFNGGREVQFEGEDRILVPSPKVATYDLQPEMSIYEVTEKVVNHLRETTSNLVVLNFANPDMVGHTGVFEAAVKAVEAVDECSKTVVEAALEKGYIVEILADHGNADKMINPDGTPNTAHTTALVPHLILKEGFEGPIRDGKLGDIAPTILGLMGLEAPAAMTGTSLIE